MDSRLESSWYAVVDGEVHVDVAAVLSICGADCGELNDAAVEAIPAVFEEILPGIPVRVIQPTAVNQRSEN